MPVQQKQKNEPLCDVFATQGILVVSFCILIAVLHLTAPEYCAAMLRKIREIAGSSPDLTETAAKVTAWFASVFSA